MPLGESQSGVASVMVSKEGGNSGSGRDRPTGGPRGLGPPWPKEKKRIFFNDYIYIYLFISRVVPRSSKNLDLFSIN